MKIKFLKKLGFFGAVLLLAGCSDPIKTVQSDQMSASYDQAYWTELSSGNPQIYNQAVSYCQHNTTKPNCSAVIDVWFKIGYVPVPAA